MVDKKTEKESEAWECDYHELVVLLFCDVLMHPLLAALIIFLCFTYIYVGNLNDKVNVPV